MPLTLNPLTPLELVSNIPNFIRGARADSLLDYTAATRVEPLALVDIGLWNQPYITDVMQSALTMFASLYLSAVSISTTINGVSISRRLEQFNPRRDPINGLADTVARLVSVEQMKFGLPTVSKISTEGFKIDKLMDGDTEAPNVGTKLSKENLQILRENSNLSVGKILDVDFTSGGETATTQVTVRLNTIPTPALALLNIMEGAAPNKNTKDRRYAVKAEQLHGLRDFIGCADLLDKRRKAILNDPTGLYMQSIRDARKNSLTGWLTGKPSVASASQIVIISEDTAVELEKRMTIRMSNPKHRERLFKESSMLVIYVVDQEFQQVTIYYRNIDKASTVSIANMQNSNKNGGSDIKSLVDILKDRNAPSF